jgi:GMP synthase (glutamine-hydrolysing)
VSGLRLLVLDAYAKAGREALVGAGGTPAGSLYASLLQRLAPGVRVDVAHPADGEPLLPAGRALCDYAGIVWTGSSLTIHAAEDERVRAQVELAREIRRQGIRSFGSCWAAQIACVAAGGRCDANPRGREFGVSRSIVLTDAGRAHPLYRDKPARFDGLTSHADHVVSLGSGTARLAGNAWSAVQAVSVDEPDDHFWAVQYHPEYDLHEVASLARQRRDELVAQGAFASNEAADAWIADMEKLHRDPSQHALARRHGLDASVLDEELRTREVRNWLASLDGRAP